MKVIFWKNETRTAILRTKTHQIYGFNKIFKHFFFNLSFYFSFQSIYKTSDFYGIHDNLIFHLR